MTAFEKMAKKLGLSPKEFENSTVLREWVRENMDEKYVPMYLLKQWGFVKEEDQAA